VFVFPSRRKRKGRSCQQKIKRWTKLLKEKAVRKGISNEEEKKVCRELTEGAVVWLCLDEVRGNRGSEERDHKKRFLVLFNGGKKRPERVSRKTKGVAETTEEGRGGYLTAKKRSAAIIARGERGFRKIRGSPDFWGGGEVT